MDNNTSTDTTTDSFQISEVAKIIAVETGRAVAITVAQYAGTISILAIGGVVLHQTEKAKARRAAKKTQIES